MPLLAVPICATGTISGSRHYSTGTIDAYSTGTKRIIQLLLELESVCSDKVHVGSLFECLSSHYNSSIVYLVPGYYARAK